MGNPWEWSTLTKMVTRSWDLSLVKMVPGIVEVIWLPMCCNSFRLTVCWQELEMFMVLSACFPGLGRKVNDWLRLLTVHPQDNGS